MMFCCNLENVKSTHVTCDNNVLRFQVSTFNFHFTMNFIYEILIQRRNIYSINVLLISFLIVRSGWQSTTTFELEIFQLFELETIKIFSFEMHLPANDNMKNNNYIWSDIHAKWNNCLALKLFNCFPWSEFRNSNFRPSRLLKSIVEKLLQESFRSFTIELHHWLNFTIGWVSSLVTCFQHWDSHQSNAQRMLLCSIRYNSGCSYVIFFPPNLHSISFGKQNRCQYYYQDIGFAILSSAIHLQCNTSPIVGCCSHGNLAENIKLNIKKTCDLPPSDLDLLLTRCKQLFSPVNIIFIRFTIVVNTRLRLKWWIKGHTPTIQCS